MKMSKPDKGALFVLAVVLGFSISAEGQLCLIFAGFEKRLEVW
jgi:hypothetical protein